MNTKTARQMQEQIDYLNRKVERLTERNNNLQEEIDTLSARNADLEHFYMAEKGPKIHNLIGHV